MANQKQPKSADEILREMEAMAGDSGGSAGKSAAAGGGGALKSLMNFFVTVVPDEEKVEEDAAKPKPAAAAAPPPPRTGPRVADLVAGEPAPKFAAPSGATADLSQKKFEDIYTEAGLNDSPCSVDELAKLMENPAVASQPISVKVIAVNLTLSAKGVGLDVPIADAVRRDRVLDAYQTMLAERARAAEQRNQARIQQLTQETEEYLKRKQAEMDALRSETAEAQRQSLEFSLRREEEEKRLAGLITPFLEGKPNPVSVGNQ